MLNGWLILSLILMLADWAAVWRGWSWVNYFTKPGVMLALMAWFVSTAGSGGNAPWFLAGLAASLLGDILLLLPRHFFVYGLVAFLAALLAYAIGLNIPLLPPTPLMMILAVLTVAAWVALVALVLPHVKNSPDHCKMAGPVGVYAAAMCLMAFSALHTLGRPDWPLSAAVLAANGGLLFFFSDALLAFDRFIRPLPHARLFVRIPYHLGQLGLIAGALLALTSG